MQWVKKEDWALQGRKGELQSQQTCLTYSQRYHAYRNPLPTNLRQPFPSASSTALLYHVDEGVLWPPFQGDGALAIRALITELKLGSGIDVFLAVRLPGSLRRHGVFRSNLPEEIRERVILYGADTSLHEHHTGHSVPVRGSEPSLAFCLRPRRLVS